MAQFVEQWTGDQRVSSSRLTAGGVSVLCPQARHFILCLALVQHRKTGHCPNVTEKLLTET